MLLVSACDKLHNARVILMDYRLCGDTLFERFNGGKEGTLWYYPALVDGFRNADAPAALVDELEPTVSELEQMSA